MTRRLTAAALAGLLLLGACADAPDPGDLAAFCSLLESGVGLATTSGEADYAQLALVAPPDVRPTIDSLQNRARDFDELLADDPPDLQALFLAKFDRAAEGERATLDRFAEDSCGLEVDRPPATRWASFVRDRHRAAPWRDVVVPQFEVDSAGRIAAVTMVFPEAPDSMNLVEDVCNAASEFLIADGSFAGARPDVNAVRVLLGTVVVLEIADVDDECQLP